MTHEDDVSSTTSLFPFVEQVYHALSFLLSFLYVILGRQIWILSTPWVSYSLPPYTTQEETSPTGREDQTAEPCLEGSKEEISGTTGGQTNVCSPPQDTEPASFHGEEFPDDTAFDAW
eukprot:CAMPEP_0113874652 /NCGR_PEP_ID=MMETSP0780_2-20120614/4460_1 /TAXON_ID=652834 /ORGANISM="Palpitomonas bilix" /LENGTH=117 /DNA_ID=CAMNT_0000860463 /DNA_START=664 /DNA_END=1014 /DNA_ORIENTATION=- /assembly_acc=CAM_ASM_000599